MGAKGFLKSNRCIWKDTLLVYNFVQMIDSNSFSVKTFSQVTLFKSVIVGVPVLGQIFVQLLYSFKSADVLRETWVPHRSSIFQEGSEIWS